MAEIASPMTRTDPATKAHPSFVEWGAVLAGAVLAAALSFTLLSFGMAIGLSATSPWPNVGLPAKVIASLAVFWTMAQQIGALMVGGYVAGRVRSRWHESSPESEFRDGLHGGLVWAVGVILSALLAFTVAGVAAKTGAEFAGRAASSTSAADSMETVLDTLLRPTVTAQAATPNAAPSTGAGTPRTPATSGGSADETRTEISRILANSAANGTLSAGTRAYLAQLVGQRTGMSQQDAEKRVDNAINAARETADKARRAAILTGFVTAAGLIISLGAAWWAGIRGGHHRDSAVPARFVFGDRRRTSRD